MMNKAALKNQIFFEIILIVLIFISKNSFSNELNDTDNQKNDAPKITTPEIVADTISAFSNCLKYKIKGVCYWSGKTGVNTTLYVEHYLPDVVVVVFNKAGENPWTEISLGLDEAGKLAQKNIVSGVTGFDSGSGQHSLADVHEQNVFFKEVDIVGNPALLLLPNELMLLPSTSTSLIPYYQSMLDTLLWKGLPPYALPEEAYALGADITHHVGTGIINWGGIYPREGKITTSSDAKAAAVIAQRSGDLITSENAHLDGHIFLQLSNQCGQHCKAYPIEENSEKTLFQMIYPQKYDEKDKQCDFFGKTLSYGDSLESKGNGAYVFVIWRFYQGCKDGDGKFMGVTKTGDST